RQALRGKEKLRYQLYDAVKAAVKQSAGWEELKDVLQKQGVRIQYKYSSGTTQVQGISFEKDGFKMKGSAVDRAFSYSRLNEQLYRNYEMRHHFTDAHKPSPAGQIREALGKQQEYYHSRDAGESLLGILLKPEFCVAEPEPEDEAERRRRRRKKHGQSQKTSR